MSQVAPQVLSVEQVFASGRYTIPIYQRAYAWGRDEIATLLRDVRDYRRKGAHSYYIGSLVTHARADPLAGGMTFEVVDGQQRLTTLYLTLAVLSQLGGDLAGTLVFEGRERSSADLALLARWGPRFSVDDLSEFAIKVGVETVLSAQANGEFDDADLQYLLTCVRVVRTTLPAQTDLNHYFEVMNSRGEQLEKHEIVKAALMGKLTNLGDGGAASSALARLWDACSDMHHHLASRFSTTSRTALFGPSWDRLAARSFADVIESLRADAAGTDPRATIDSILCSSEPTTAAPKSDDTDETDRYGSIIDFPNFLLHVLALSVSDRVPFSWTRENGVSLDDKLLVSAFEQRITNAEQVMHFAYELLRSRFLFDQFVIKTDRSRSSEDDSNWVLHRTRRLEGGKLSPVSTFARQDDAGAAGPDVHEHVVMLQAMFQVTDSRRSYKNFLYAILDFLTRQEQDEEIDGVAFIQFMQGLAASRHANTIDPGALDRGTSVPHFTLNYLDYLLWLASFSPDVRASYPAVPFGAYRFRYRSSVEHFYPQHPDPGSNIAPLPREVVDRFGNLCLMSRSENSRRSNLAPAAKIGQYRSDQQSLKFQVMADITKAGVWDEAQIMEHGADMLGYLEQGPRTAPSWTPPDG